VRFWDSSAVLPLLVTEPGTNFAIARLREDPSLALWALTRLELASSIERRFRERRLTAPQRRQALSDIARLCGDAHEVTDVLAVRERAAALLAHHALRAADACQLAAALVVADANPGASLEFVVLDRRLAAAADIEGLNVLSWPDDR
jgi:predicted nucleic acid-binding protein